MGWLQDIVKVLVAGFAVFVAFVPRRKSPPPRDRRPKEAEALPREPVLETSA